METRINREAKSDRITQKCAAAGCKEEAIKRHHQMYVFDGWDPHPDPDFKKWVLERWEKEEKEDREYCEKLGKDWKATDKPNAITLWNSQKERDEWTQIKEGIL